MLMECQSPVLFQKKVDTHLLKLARQDIDDTLSSASYALGFFLSSWQLKVTE
jgi:hypothetical protein